MKKAIDNFSKQTEYYVKFRPVYPQDFYHYLFSLINKFDQALDCGTGNGQVALVLSEKFNQVTATDISENQLKNAARAPNIHYLKSRAEQTDFPENTFDLITVAQAAHWFDLPAFYNEVNKISKPGAVLAMWGYQLLRIDPETDKLIRDFYECTLAGYWDKERQLVDEGYSSIRFPFEEVQTPQAFYITDNWTKNQLLGYLNSWSGVQNYIQKNGQNPIEKLEAEINAMWPDDVSKSVRFPIFSRIGFVRK